MTQKELAKLLGLSIGTVSKKCQEGMPRDLAGAKDWIELRKAGRHRKLPKPKAQPAAAEVLPALQGLTAGTLSYALAQHRMLVDRARDTYLAAIEGNDPAQSKLQSAYNASLKTLLDLEDEEKKRAIEARDYIKLTEAQEIIERWTAKVVQKWDKLKLEAAEACNPDRPEVAIKALDAWTLEARKSLATPTV
jgi:tRNA A37 N6-isopentenylltransferase MiaA